MNWTAKLAGKKRDTSIGRILQNTAWLLGGKGVGGVLSLFYLAILTRSLGPAGFGHFALIQSTAQIVVTFVSFETWQIIVKFGQNHVRDGDPGRFGRLMTFCMAIDLLGALIGCLIAGGAIFLLGPYFGWDRTISLEAFAFASVMLFTIRSSPMGILRLFDKFDTGAIAETMVPVGRMIGALIVWISGPSITGFLIAWAAAELLCAATYWTLAIRTANTRMAGWTRGGFLKARLENEGLLTFLTATNISTTVASMTRQVSVIIVGFFAGPAGAGLYRLAYQIAISLTKVSGLLSRTIFAELARVSAHSHAAELVRLFRRTNRLALAAAATVALVVAVLGKPLLALMAGAAFAQAYPLLLLLGLAAAVDLVGVSFEPLLMATGRAAVSVRIRLFNAAVLLGLFALLLPGHGAMGAAGITLAISLLGLALMGLTARRALSDASHARSRADPSG